MEQSNIIEREFKKIKLESTIGIRLEYTERVTTEKDGETFTDSSEFTLVKYKEVHPDLKACFDKLKPYVLNLCEITDEVDSADTILLGKIKVTGVTIGGSDEHEGCTLIAQRILKHGKVLNLITPFMKWEDEYNGYDHSYEVAGIVRELQHECELYLSGKYAPEKQLELDLK